MKIFSLSAIAIMALLSFSSCLKDKDANNKYGFELNDNKAVFFAQGSGTADTAFLKTSASPSTTPSTLQDIQINLAGTDPLDKDVTVTVALDNGLLVNSGLTALPAGSLTFPTTVVIKKGTQFIKLPFTIANTSILSLTTNYGFGIVISSADNSVGVIQAKRKLRVQLNIKNIYDGIYKVIGGNVLRYTGNVPNMGDILNGPLAGNPDVRLITTGATSLSIPIPGAPGALFWAQVSGSQVAGIDGVTVNVNPTTNLTTSSSTGNATFANWAGKVNSYDPATKTFRLSWRWNPTGNIREYEIVLEYKEPRP